MRALAITALAALAIGAAGCVDDGVSATSGTEAFLRVQGGRYVEGAFPASLPPADAGVDLGSDAGTPGDDAGMDVDAGLPPPLVTSLAVITSRVRQGFRGKSVGLLVSANARTVAVGLEVASGDGTSFTMDRGYWIAPVGLPSLEAPPNLEAPVTLDFSSELPVGDARLIVAAQDEAGRFGPARTLDLQITSAIPVEDLVVALDWTADMDLDLVVVAPDGTSVSFAGVRGPDGAAVRPGPDVPYADIDSNAGCVIDGARLESVAWPYAPAGLYQVFVRASASCGAPSTGWRIRILRGVDVVGTATGATYASQVDAPGGGPTGTGILGATFVVGE